jgi:hypothetical protein
VLDLFECLPVARKTRLELVPSVNRFDLGQAAFEGLKGGAGVLYVLEW